jgi:hypothetical protein
MKAADPISKVSANTCRKDGEYIVHYADGKWVCSECRHGVGVHPEGRQRGRDGDDAARGGFITYHVTAPRQLGIRQFVTEVPRNARARGTVGPLESDPNVVEAIRA